MPLTDEDFVKLNIHEVVDLLPPDASIEDRSRLIAKWERARVAKFGWVGHFVGGDPNMPYELNVHTHGVMESFGHPDFQIVLPLSPDVLNSVLYSLVNLVKEGTVLVAGSCYSGIIRGFDVRLMLATEQDRQVLRVIFPDEDGNLDKDKMTERYAAQYGGCEDA